MIEVENIEKIDKGALLAMCDVHIKPWKLTLCEVKIFQKGQNMFLGMPSRSFTNDAGDTKYVELIKFDSDSVKKRFQSQILKAVEEYLEKNPNMEPEPIIVEDEAAPF